MKKKILWITLSAAAAVLLIAIVFFFANDFRVEMKRKGKNVVIEYGAVYEDRGAKATFKSRFFGNTKLSVTTDNPVNTNKIGKYTVTYTAKKWLWEGKVTRRVKVVDTTPPEIRLKGGTLVIVTRGTAYEDLGFEAVDNCDGVISCLVDGEVNTNAIGEYVISYTATDKSGNTTEILRSVIVQEPHSPENPDKIIDAVTVIPEKPTVYLTFDDGPGPYTEKLLNILKKYNVKATFFVTDKGKYNHLIARMASEGHAVGIHTASHSYKKIYASEEAFFADQQIVQDIIIEQTGSPTKLMRFPGGSSNTASRFNPGIMTRLALEVTSRGMRYFDWNADSKDAGGARSAEEVADNIIEAILKGDYANVLQHDLHEYSVDAVEDVIRWALDAGYTFAPLDETSPTCHHTINN